MLFSLLYSFCLQNRASKDNFIIRNYCTVQYLLGRIPSYLISLLGASFFNTSSTPKLPQLTGDRGFLAVVASRRPPGFVAYPTASPSPCRQPGLANGG